MAQECYEKYINYINYCAIRKRILIKTTRWLVVLRTMPKLSGNFKIPCSSYTSIHLQLLLILCERWIYFIFGDVFHILQLQIYLADGRV